MIEYYVMGILLLVNAAVLCARILIRSPATPATLGDLAASTSLLGLIIVAYAEKILSAIEAAQTAAVT